MPSAALFALYAAEAHHDNKPDAEQCLLKLFGSGEDIPERLLQQWSGGAELLGSKKIGHILSLAPVKPREAIHSMTMQATFSTLV